MHLVCQATAIFFDQVPKKARKNADSFLHFLVNELPKKAMRKDML